MTAQKKVLRLEEIEAEELHGGGVVRRIITKATTGIDITFSQARLTPGAGHTWHTHEKEDEAVFVLSGKGTMYFEDEEVKYEPNMSIIIPRGVKHQNINTSDDEIVLVSMFNPAIR